MSRYFAVLRNNPDFTRLWLAQVISLTGDWFNTIVLSALVVAYSPGNEGLAISAFLLARFVPPMILSPFAGVLVDRFNRKHLMIWSNLLRTGVVLLLLLTLGHPDRVWLIYVLTVLQFTLSTVFEPGQSALIPMLLRRDDLVEGNTLVSITWSVMLALGAILGGLVATIFGSATALVFDAMTFLIAAGLIASIESYTYRSVKQRREEDADETDTSLIEGLRYLRRHPEVASNILVKFGGSVGNIDALMTIFATKVFVLGVNGQLSLSIMYSAFGFGAILGPVVLNRINDGSPRRMRRLILIGFAWSVISWMVLGVAGGLLVVCVGLLIRAMGTSANWTYSTVLIQKTTADTHMGRVFSFDWMGFYFATVTSTVIHGWLIDLVGSSPESIAWPVTLFTSVDSAIITGTLIDLFGSSNVQTVVWLTVIPSMVPLLLWGVIVRWLEKRAGVPATALAT